MQKMPLKIYINEKYGFLSRLPLKMKYSKNEFSSSYNVNLTFFKYFFLFLYLEIFIRVEICSFC